MVLGIFVVVGMVRVIVVLCCVVLSCLVLFLSYRGIRGIRELELEDLERERGIGNWKWE